MSNQTGKIEYVKKNEQYGYFSMKIGDTWYGCGKEDVTGLQGQMVSFEAGTNAKGYATAKNVQPAQGAAPTSAPQKASGGSHAVHGATVGMAINNAVAAFVAGKIERSGIPEFSSALIKLSHALESGRDFGNNDSNTQHVEPDPQPAPPPAPEPEPSMDDDLPF